MLALELIKDKKGIAFHYYCIVITIVVVFVGVSYLKV